jgi:WD40 repeat protein
MSALELAKEIDYTQAIGKDVMKLTSLFCLLFWISAAYGQEGTATKVLRGHQSWVWAVAWSPDGEQLATASADKTAKIWDLASEENLLTLSGHTDSVISVAWRQDGKQLATASADKTAKVWDAASGKVLPEPCAFAGARLKARA